jgi:hypothetical protein
MNDTLVIASALAGLTLLSVLIPVLLVRRRRQRRKDALLALLQQVADEHRLSFDSIDPDGHRLLALDTRARQLYYASHAREERPSRLIDLSQVRACRLHQVTTRDQQTRKTGFEDHVLQISLCLEQRTGEVVELPIYHEAEDGVYELLRLRQLATQWQARLTPLLGHHPPVSA